MERRKGFNFRFSVREMADIDELVRVFNLRRDHYLIWRTVGRTEVIRYLVKKELAEIDDQARKQLETECSKSPRKADKKPRTKKGVKK